MWGTKIFVSGLYFPPQLICRFWEAEWHGSLYQQQNYSKVKCVARLGDTSDVWISKWLLATLIVLSHDSPVNCNVISYTTRAHMPPFTGLSWLADSSWLWLSRSEFNSHRASDIWVEQTEKGPWTQSVGVCWRHYLWLQEVKVVEWLVRGFCFIQSVSTCSVANLAPICRDQAEVLSRNTNSGKSIWVRTFLL